MAEGVFGVQTREKVGTTFAVSATVLFAVLLLVPWNLSWIAVCQRPHQGLAPGPINWPLLGALPYLGKYPYRSLYKMSKKYGPVMYMHLGSHPTLVVSNAEMAEEVLRTNDQLISSRPQLVLVVTSLLGSGRQDIVTAPYGPHWRQVRKIADTQLPTSSKLVHFTKVMKGEILAAVHAALEQSQVERRENVNVSAVFSDMTLNIITQAMWNKIPFHANGSHSHFSELVRRTVAFSACQLADFSPSSLKSFAISMTGVRMKPLEVHGGILGFCETVIREHERALSEEAGKKAAAAAEDDNFVHTLLKLTNQPGSHGLSREAIEALLLDMILAGTDTTAVTLEWIFTELLKNPEMMKKAQDELTAVVGDDRLVSETDIPNLKYLDAVVKEGLRMYTALPLIPRHSVAECKVGGYDVPANTTVFVNLFAIHHDPTVWKNAWEFNPDRFLECDKDYRGMDYDYIPFGSGRRACPGVNFASTILHLGLAQFLHAVSWSLPNGQAPESVDMTQASSVRIGTRSIPLRVNAKPRLPHHVLYPVTA